MKYIKILLILLVIALLFIGVSVYAKSKMIEKEVQTYKLNADGFPSYSLLKFVDGNVTCYTFQTPTTNAISCLK